MEKTLNEPILIIKTSWGGRNLLIDFAPPSAPPEELRNALWIGPYSITRMWHEMKERLPRESHMACPIAR